MKTIPRRMLLTVATILVVLVTIVTSCVLYPVTYSVSYFETNNAAGSVPIDSNTYESGATVTVLDNTGELSRSGYAFTGWNTVSDGSGTTYSAGDQLTIGSADVELYAQWEEIPKYWVKYRSYDSDGGYEPYDGNSYYEGDTVTVLGNTDGLYRTGYTFIGWNTESDYSGTDYSEGDEFTIGTEDVFLYANWTSLPTYNVVYNADLAESGSVPIDAQNYLEDSSVTVQGNTGGLTRVGYSFSCWNTSADGNGVDYTIGQSFTMGTSDVDLYAQWIPVYTVTYHAEDADSGSVPVDSNYYPESVSATVIGNTGNLIRAGYFFDGWNTALDGNGTDYAEGGQISIGTFNIDLYAQWVNTSTVTIENSESPTFNLSPTSFTLQTGGGTTVQLISVTAGSGVTISSYNWFINGTSRGFDASISLDTEVNPVWFETGQNTLTLVVVIDGMPYSNNFIFTMEQY